MYYYFLEDGTIPFLGLLPPFFSFVLKCLLYYLYFAGYAQHSKISLGSTHVFGLAYISSNVLIINFFLLAFFWVSVETSAIEPSSGVILENDTSFVIKSVEDSVPKFPCPFIFPEGVEKPFLIQHVETIGLDAFYKGVEEASKLPLEEISEIFKNPKSV